MFALGGDTPRPLGYTRTCRCTLMIGGVTQWLSFFCAHLWLFVPMFCAHVLWLFVRCLVFDLDRSSTQTTATTEKTPAQRGFYTKSVEPETE